MLGFFKRHRKSLLMSTLLLFAVGVVLLGVFMNASQKPQPSDLIVSLGGGDGSRIRHALKLYHSGYSTKGIFLYTGREIVNPALKPPLRFEKRVFLQTHGIPAEKIIYVPRGVIVNTAEELFFLKDFMQKHGYKSALIVSSPYHTRRIRALADYIVGFEKAGLRLSVTGYKPAIDPLFYLFHEETRNRVWLEFEKMLYNLLKYSPLTIDKTAYAKKRNTPLWQEAL